MSQRAAPVSRLRASIKLLRLTGLLFRGLWTIYTRFSRLDEEAKTAEVRRWSQDVLQALGVRQETSGAAEGAGVLYVCNHVSWLDIIAINAAAPVHFVSKSDVKAWPVVGRLVSAAGTLFIERESRRDAMRVVHQVADALRSGDRIAFFPEGTTSDGRGLLPFHANLLQAAISSACPVQAMAICYADAWESPSSSAAYIGDDTLIQSIWAIARAPGLTVRLRYGAVHETGETDRRTLSGEVREAVSASLTALLAP